jgi:murein DD-endopeptidase MepM/ murein hydrolase activator NlpD
METVLLNASVDVQRVLGRLRRPSSPQDQATTASHSTGSDSTARRHVRARVGPAAASSHISRRSRRRLALTRPTLPNLSLSRTLRTIGHDRAVALVVAGIVVGASVFSLGPAAAASGGDIGGPSGPGDGSRIAIGGAPVGTGWVVAAYPEASASAAPNVSAAQDAETVDGASTAGQTAVEGPFLADGTLLKPVAVDTTVADGSALVKTYKVKPGDTLSGIAQQFGVSTMSVWWANDLKDKADLKQGQELRIPPVSGLIVEVKATDTLASLAKSHDVEPAEIIELNGLEDPNLVVGQVLVVPGARGKPIATPTPRPTPKPVANSGGGGGSNNGGGSSSGGGSARPPRTYSGGNFAWPAPGGRISQYYRYGHYGLDIDGDTGDAIIAAAKGTVIFAGWKNNGGGYQVWIAHGSGLYTTYNHMSSVSVGNGQSVGKGQRVGRMGATGFATGSHLHFEVWKGPIWNGGKRVNPLGYL